jgi:flagellar motor switch protein FliG
MMHGKEKIAKILSHMRSKDSKVILSDIASKDDKLADEIEQMMFTFEDILEFSAKDIQLLHKNIDKNDLLLAMKGLSPQLTDKLLSGVSSNKKTTILEDLEQMGKVKLSEVESARLHIMDIIRKMIEAGEISLDDEWIE